MPKINALLNKIKFLEKELLEEVQHQQEDFVKKIKQKSLSEKKSSHPFLSYLKNAPIKHILSAPVIWMVIIPTILLDITVTVYQTICFPLYHIPKVKREDYLVFDRQLLNYLNIIEKINCAYCSYFTGVIAFTQEIAARTEQFWCPIKHARRMCTLHSRYQKFIAYDDETAYRQYKEQVRHNFDDIK